MDPIDSTDASDITVPVLPNKIKLMNAVATRECVGKDGEGGDGDGDGAAGIEPWLRLQLRCRRDGAMERYAGWGGTDGTWCEEWQSHDRGGGGKSWW
jgi:hypothetical protein